MVVVRFCSVTWSFKGSALDLLCLPGFDCVASEYVAATVYAFVSAWAVSMSRVGECVGWLRCRLSFALLRSLILWRQGSSEAEFPPSASGGPGIKRHVLTFLTQI